MINFDELTLGQVEEIELLVGRSIDEVFDNGKPKGRALRAIVYVIMKQDNPNYTFEETIKITQTQALEMLGATDPKVKK